MDHKNIDELFQNQLKNLEVSPNERVWNTIETKLKKKKHRFIPFWLFPASVAALIALGLFIFPFSESKNQLEKMNEKEIITTTPKNENIIESKLDSIIIRKTKSNPILISHQKSESKQEKSVKNIVTKTAKKQLEVYKKPVKGIALNYNNFDVNFSSSVPDVDIQFNNDIYKKPISTKIDINTLVNKKDSLFLDNETINQWSVAPVFAVLKSNSFSNSSPIDANLANSTQGESSFSYGVQVAYKINKRWTVQSGIHLQETNYTNNQVAITPALQGDNSTTEFINGGAFSFDKNVSDNISFSTNSLINTINTNGNLTQNYGYIEIPIEVKYNFSTLKNFETQLVTGFSSLFLNKNNVNLNTQILRNEGKATNLNNINFSGNLGFDFNYLFDKNWSINLNPMLKVQLNTFSENSNGFAPFNIGMYTGITYKF
jgi:hypothetical protein